MKTLTCVECGISWTVPITPGRYPDRCEEHRLEAARRRREKWIAAHPERARECYKKYRDNNREACNRRIADWNERNSERRKATIKAWKARNKDLVLEQNRANKKKNYDPIRKRIDHLWSNYRLRPNTYAMFLAARDGCCWICGTPEPKPYGFHVDHDHETGRIRGLLCKRCNPGLGLFKDDPARLRAAADYLERGNLDDEAANRSGVA